MVIKRFTLKTKGDCDIINITDKISDILKGVGFDSGIVNVFVVGSTAGLSVIEYEPNLERDFKDFFNRIIPKDIKYYHHETWNDDNGHSHIRASLLKPDITVPYEKGKMILGQWQQIILVDFDTGSRDREVIVSVIEG
ncbi:YjbQ family protein [Candidatus Pacearchaeota archaeon]|nr:YjbQ family protein [Candidatus Pacearchaeota archaeon]